MIDSNVDIRTPKRDTKVSNKRLKDELNYKLSFPSFKDGLRAIYKSSKEF